MRAILVPADAPPTVINLESDYTALQQCVGGFFESIPVGVPGAMMYVNEEGLLRGLPRNQNLDTFKDMRVVLQPGQHIVGNAVIVGKSVTGEVADAPREIIEEMGLC